MEIRGRKINPWKILVLTWFAINTIKLGRALIKAKRLKNKKTKKQIISKYADL